jgi:hypothetical protein
MTSPSPVTPQLLNVLSYDTKVGENDAPFSQSFPYVAMPWSGTGKCSGEVREYTQPEILPPLTTGVTGLGATEVFAFNQPNPFSSATTIRYHLRSSGRVSIHIYDPQGKLLTTLCNENKTEGDYEVTWDASGYPSGIYNAVVSLGTAGRYTIRMNKID